MDRSLVAFAFLAQASRANNDLLTGLAPLFKPIAKTHAGKPFDAEEFSELVATLYGIKVNAWAVEDFAPRLAAAGVLQRVQVAPDVHRYVYAPIQEEFAAVTEADVGSICEAFRKFSRPILERHGIEVTDEQLESAFLHQLVDLNFIAIVIKPEAQEAAAPDSRTLRLKKPPEQIAWEKETEAQARIDVLCASFILEVHRNRRELYDLLVRIVSGALVAEVVLDFQEPQFKGKLDTLTVILDAPFLMSLLDVSSEESHDVAAAVCDELRERKVQLATFEHCIAELRDNLMAVRASFYNGEAFGDTARRLHSSAFHAYVNAVIQDPLVSMKAQGIRVIPTLQSDATYQFFTEEDELNLMWALGLYRNELARRRDASSISNVVRLRRGARTRMSAFGLASYVFVTQNTRVVDVARKFILRNDLYADGEVPPAITDRYLAGLLWIMYGGKAEDLAPKLLLANCAAALAPRSDLINRMHKLLTEISPEQAQLFRALMTDERAGQHLMEVTLGDSMYLNSNNVSQVLEQVKSTLTEEERKAAEARLAEARAKHQRESERQAAKESQLREEIRQAKQSQGESEREVGALREQLRGASAAAEQMQMEAIEEQRKRVEKIARRLASERHWVYLGVGYIAAIAAGGIALWLAFAPNSTPARILGPIGILLITGLGFWKMPEVVIEPPLTRWLEKRLEAKLHELEIYGAERRFEIDLKAGTVKTRAEDARPPGRFYDVSSA